MKIAIINDLHAGARNNSLIFDSYFQNFYSTQFFPYLEKNSIDTVLILGDVFDNRKNVDFRILDSWQKNIFSKLNEKYQTHILLGNHDCVYKNSNQTNSLEILLDRYKNIHIVKENSVMTFDGTVVALIPWVVPEEMDNTKAFLKSVKAEVVMGHFDIISFQMYAGLVNNDHGFDLKDFERFDLVMSGHYHQKSSQANVHYLGAPYEMIWTDCEQPRGFHVFGTQNRKLAYIKNPLQMFYKVDYARSGLYDFSKFQNCYLKVLLNDRENDDKFQKFLEKIYAANPADVVVIDSNLKSDVEFDTINESKDTLAIIKEYVDSLDGITEDNRKGLTELMSKLYIDSMNLTTQI